MDGLPESNTEEVSSEKDILQKRKEQLLAKFKGNKNWLAYIILIVIVYLGYFLRTRNLAYLTDITTGKYIPLALDPFAFLRYVEYLVENGSWMTFDALRYYPWGYGLTNEFKFLSYLITYMYKIWSFFVPSITLEYVHVMYPVVCFMIAIVFFYLFVRDVFDWRVGLLASAFLTVLPAYLYRTMAGFADKESAAMMFMFIGLYFFVRYVKTKKLTSKLILAAISGISIGFMGLIWGGVSFMFLAVGGYILLNVFFNNFSKSDFYGIFAFIAALALTMWVGYPEKYSIINLLTSDTSGIMFLAFAVALVNYIVFQKDLLKLKSKLKFINLPPGVTSLIFIVILVFIAGISAYGLEFITGRISGLWSTMINTPSSRWILTVAESHQPYFIDVINQFNWKFVVLFFAGATFLFYSIVRHLKEKYYLTGGFLAFILLFSFSRYKQTSVLDGETNLALALYAGSLAIFVIGLAYYYLYSYYKDKETYLQFNNFDKSFVLILVVFFFLLIGARTAIRLLFSFAPIAAILSAFAVFFIIDKSKVFKDNIYRIGTIAVIAALAIFMLFSFYNTTLSQAKYTGPSYNQQWQVGMDWVRDSTPTDAVFAHWWDYGYWVQYGGERATLSDGGNALGDINHFVGRHLLTAEDENEALEYLAARNTTHVLMISDEIGKYGAYSSIGADENYDRYSWINTYSLDYDQMQETRNGTIFTYVGGTVLDEDVIYQDQVYPAMSAGIAGFVIPTIVENNGTEVTYEQPTAVISYQGQQVGMPLKCIYIEYSSEYIEFDTDGEYLDACLHLIPTYSGEDYNPIGAGLYLSPRVSKGLFGRLYLMELEEEFPHFELAYTDESSMPLSIYNGQLIGPLKIWEVTYPDDFVIPQEYFSTEADPSVIMV